MRGYLSQLKNETGSALVAALGMATVFGILITISFKSISLLENTSRKSTLTAIERSSLNSLMDYTIMGIKNRWCFQNTMLRDTNSQCTLSHPGNTLRLLMSDSGVESYTQLSKSKDTVRLKSIKRKLYLSMISTSHPFYKMVGNIKKNDYSHFFIKISRESSDSMPSVGSQTFLTIEIQLVPNPESKKDIVSINSGLITYPRELNTNSLVVAGDLYLFNSGDSSPGSAVIQQVGPESSGIVFESPVYVNGNVHIPPDNSYSNVTFANKLILGDGSIYKNGEPISPSSGTQIGSRYVSDLATFGGFLGGISYDEGRDPGLDYLSTRLSAQQSVDTQKMDACISLNIVLSDLQYTAKSSLLGRVKASNHSSNSNGEYYSKTELSLSNGNYFKEQDSLKPKVISFDGDYFSNPKLSGKDKEGSRLGAVISIDDGSSKKKVKVDFSHGNSTEIKPMFFDLAKLEDDLNDATSKSRDQNSDKRDIEKDKKDIERQLSETTRAADQIRKEIEELELSNSSNTTIQNLKDSIRVAVTRLRQVRDELEGDPDNTLLIGERDTLAAQVADQRSELDVASDNSDLTKFKKDLAKLNDKLDKLNKDLSSLDRQLSGVDQNIQKTAADIKKARSLHNFAVSVTAKPPTIIFKISSHLLSGHIQENRLTLETWINNLSKLGPLKYDSNTNKVYVKPVTVEVELLAYDVASISGQSTRPASEEDPNFSRRGNFSYLINGNSKPSLSFESADWKVLDEALRDKTFVNLPPNEAIDYAALENDCQSYGGKTGDVENALAFDSVSWGTSFSKQTRHSWNFADPLNAIWRIDSGIADFSKPEFLVRSIVKVCSIEASARVLVGFLVCDKLIIQPRSTSLKIVGTIIAGKVFIDGSAVAAGINWSSINHPNATDFLRQKMILKLANGKKCSESKETPVWHPNMNMYDRLNSHLCNTISLRNFAQPFQWTMVDPDCGVSSGAVNTSCKNLSRKFVISELGRVER